jgi:hypothetical protein
MNIKTFADKLKGSGVKPSLFAVQGNIGPESQSDLTPFLVKSAQLPGSQLGVIEIPFRGRRIKVPGDRTFGDWTITIINDGKFSLRTKFERWINAIQQMEANVSTNDFTAFTPTIFQDWEVQQLDRAGNPISQYKLIGCFPTDVSPIELSFEANDQIEEFSVTLAYSYFTNNTRESGSGTPDASPLPNLSDNLTTRT